MSRESEAAARWADDCARAAGPSSASSVTQRLASDASDLVRGTSVLRSWPSGMVQALRPGGESFLGLHYPTLAEVDPRASLAAPTRAVLHLCSAPCGLCRQVSRPWMDPIGARVRLVDMTLTRQVA